MSFEEILGHFRVSRRSGDRAQCVCPCHSDRKASLSVTHKDGRTLIYCHAGCGTAEVLSAAGLQLRDLFDAPAPGRGHVRG